MAKLKPKKYVEKMALAAPFTFGQFAQRVREPIIKIFKLARADGFNAFTYKKIAVTELVPGDDGVSEWTVTVEYSP